MSPITRTIAQAAQDTGLSQDTIRQAVLKGDLPAKRVGRRIIVKVSDLTKWIDQLEDVSA